MQKEQLRLLLLSSVGGVLEFYDFIIFALFAAYIATAFFPESNEIVGLLITFATFAVGYLVRPLGGVVFGHFGDKFGRKTTFTISILIMAISTLGIAFVPSYSMIGAVAPILVITFRILQGLSIGGEIPGAITYVSESFTEHKGFACGFIFTSLTLGIVLGSVVYASIVMSLDADQMQAFGWRIPFIIGGVFGLFSFLLRKNLQESREFQAIEKSVERFPILVVLREQFASVVIGTFLTALCAVIVTLLFLFIPAYFSKILHLPANSYVWERTIAIAAGSILSALFGFMTDKICVKSLVFVLCLCTAIFAYPIFIIYTAYPQWFWVAFALSALLLGFSAGIIPRLLSELFPTKIRYSGIALSYNLGFALFGGMTPFISLSLIYYTGLITIPAAYLLLIAVLGLSSLGMIRYQRKRIILLQGLT